MKISRLVLMASLAVLASCSGTTEPDLVTQNLLSVDLKPLPFNIGPASTNGPDVFITSGTLRGNAIGQGCSFSLTSASGSNAVFGTSICTVTKGIPTTLQLSLGQPARSRTLRFE